MARGAFNFTGFTAGDLAKAKKIMSTAGTAVQEAFNATVQVEQNNTTTEQTTHYSKWSAPPTQYAQAG